MSASMDGSAPNDDSATMPPPTDVQAARALSEAIRMASHGYQLTPVTITRDVEDNKRAKFHKGWRHESAWSNDPDQIRAWWVDHPGTSFAVRTGSAGGVDVIDLDVKDGRDGVQWWAEQGHPLSSMVIDTLSDGLHLYVPACGLPTAANQFGPGVDTRGDGGLVFAPGAYIAGEAGRYSVQGALIKVSDLEPLPAELIAAIKAAAPDKATHPTDGRITYKDRDVAIRLTQAVVEKVAAFPPHTDGSLFRDAQMGAAMMLGRLAEAGACDLAGAWEMIEEATLKVWPEGLSTADEKNITSGLRDGPLKERWRFRDDPLGSPSGSSDGAEPDGDDIPSSWTPADLDALWDDASARQRPEILARTDLACLFYPGETHSVHGESESGKSWIAQLATIEVLEAGGRVLYIDYESDQRALLRRLRALGLKREWLDRLDYVSPDGPRDEAFAELLTRTYRLAVIDGVTAALSVEPDTKSNSGDDVTAWDKALPRRLARKTGAAVVMIDHVSKAKDERGRFAIGSQAKMANISGAAFYVDVESVIAVGRVGAIRIYVGKDRPSGVREKAGPMRMDRLQPFARLIFDGRVAGTIETELAPWVGDSDEELANTHEAHLGLLWWERKTEELPPEVRKLSIAAQDVWRALAHISDPDGLTVTRVRQVLDEGPRPPSKTAFYRGIGQLKEAGVVGVNGEKLTIEVKDA